ncbi:MAG TPA: class I adenylate-forming enzyme family protein [Caulobacteraceae bacterium]|jgi:acyl-coenzyme A synthetase/AMP-(fatty) acid ligase|nr:class I adenylate-forming enzyme family protein [Caulobacteraceae bacterium]
MDVVDTIFEFAGTKPHAWALVHDLEPVTYRTLHRRIGAMRRKLEGYGLKPGGVAVIWIYSTLVSWIVTLALRGLGVTTVSIRTPAELSSFGDLDVIGVITSASEHYPPIDASFVPNAPRIVVERTDWDMADDGGALEPPPGGRRGDHILLTSGTTGNYKMMIVNSDAHTAEVQAGIKLYQAQQPDPSAPLEGSANILGLGLWTVVGYNYPLGIWTIGATVILHQGPEAYRSFAVPGITDAMVTPDSLAQILASAPPDFQRNDNLTVTVTGGPLSSGLARLVRERLTNTIVTNLGSTESGGWARTVVKDDEDLRWHRLLPHRTVEVVDENDQPLPPNQLGEVRVLLDNNFTGYLNDPAASASFVKGGWFYPGDLGVLDGQGRIALHGRVTDVLNMMGNKRPSGPYERALQEALGLEGVCLMSEQGDDREEQLHVILETAGPIDEDTLRKAALAHLRGFPAARFHFVPRFPRNPMGKVERFKLRQQLIEQQRVRGQA